MPSTDSGIRPSPRIAASNAGFEGASGAGAQSPCFGASPPPVSPCYGELSPCYGAVPRRPPIFAQPIVIQIDFSARTGPETANSPCFPPVIREYQGESGREAPLDDPAEFASPQARMEPRRLEMCECRRPQGERGNGGLSYLESIARKP